MNKERKCIAVVVVVDDVNKKLTAKQNISLFACRHHPHNQSCVWWQQDIVGCETQTDPSMIQAVCEQRQIALTHWGEKMQGLWLATVSKLASALPDTGGRWLIDFYLLIPFFLTMWCCFHTVITCRVWKSVSVYLQGFDHHKYEERPLTWPCGQPIAGHLSGGLTPPHRMSTWWYYTEQQPHWHRSDCPLISKYSLKCLICVF